MCGICGNILPFILYIGHLHFLFFFSLFSLTKGLSILLVFSKNNLWAYVYSLCCIPVLFISTLYCSFYLSRVFFYQLLRVKVRVTDFIPFSISNIVAVVQSLSLTLCDPLDCGTTDFPIFHHLPELYGQ